MIFALLLPNEQGRRTKCDYSQDGKNILLLRNAKPPRPPAPGRRKGWTGDVHAAHPIRLLAGPSGTWNLVQHVTTIVQW